MSAMFLPAGRAPIRDIVLPRCNRPSLPDWIRAGWKSLATRRDRRRAIVCLRRMNDVQLRDLGITRLDVERVVRGEPATGRAGGGRP